MANRPKRKTKVDGISIRKEFEIAINDTLNNSRMRVIPDSDVVKNEKTGIAVGGDDVWKTDKLLNFQDFCSSSDHMNFPPLSERQQDVAKYMFGDDPKQMFHNNRTHAVMAWGKGSGKDSLSALMQLYVVYVLLNMKNPQKYFGQANQSSIDLLNIASTREQAQEVYFQLLKSFVLKWQWIRNMFDLVVNGRYFSTTSANVDLGNEEKVVITNEGIVFPNNIKMFSGSSEADSSEGKNLLVFVLDEVDAFKGDGRRTAEKIYRMARTSAFSRFNNSYKGFILSYPRSKDGFILKMLEKTKGYLSFYGDKGATWEILPKSKFSKETFSFEGHNVPMDFYEDFRLDPEGSKLAYMCMPPRSESSYISDYDKLESAIRTEKDLIEFKDSVEGEYIVKTIIDCPAYVDRSIDHVLCFDLSEKVDNTAIAIAHKEKDNIIIDLVTAWMPDKKKGIKVSLPNVQNIIRDINGAIKLTKVYGDHWNSALMCQNLTAVGIESETMRLTIDDYLLFKRYLYAGNIKIPNNQMLLEELKDLHQTNAARIDHSRDKHDDMASTVIMAVKALLNVSGGKSSMMTEGEYVGDNTRTNNDFQGTFVPTNVHGVTIDGIEIN